jgi:hypothetical protein
MSDDPDRMDRTTVRIYKRGEEPSDLDYWRSRPLGERLHAIEQIRREYHGWTDEPQSRLQKVYRVIERT